MVLERAIIEVKPGSESAFEAAIEQAKQVIAQAGGFRSLTLSRGIERSSIYLLLVEWDTLDDHIQGFRESELFGRWRELIGPHFASAPEVEHFGEPVATL